MGSPPVRVAPPLLLVLVVLAAALAAEGEGAQWCIVRSGASQAAVQAALDYACGAGGADCQPIQASGLCYLPNTLAAHASYAFNSFFQRSRSAPGACDFAGTATVTITDPSYGACTFPSSASTAGGSTTPSTTPNSPITNTPTTAPGMGTPTGSGTGGITGPGGTTGTGGVGGLTPIGGGVSGGGLTPANGLTPTTGVNSGFGPTVPNTDPDYSAAAAHGLALLLSSCCYVMAMLLL